MTPSDKCHHCVFLPPIVYKTTTLSYKQMIRIMQQAQRRHTAVVGRERRWPAVAPHRTCVGVRGLLRPVGIVRHLWLHVPPPVLPGVGLGTPTVGSGVALLRLLLHRGVLRGTTAKGPKGKSKILNYDETQNRPSVAALFLLSSPVILENKHHVRAVDTTHTLLLPVSHVLVHHVLLSRQADERRPQTG